MLSKRNSKPLPALSLPSASQQSYIISLNAHEISSKIRAGELSAEEVLSTFINRAYHIGRELRLSGEEPFEQALASLSSLSSKQNGVLFGVPISIKDEIDQAGCSSATGITWAAEEIKETDSVMITLLRQQGAVPFVRGSTMQGLMWYETTNNIYGTAVNPWNKDRTTGGSSGGDAGLVASRASVIGIGSDLGGSVRIPATFNGLYGFKVSSRRCTYVESVNPHPTGHHCLCLLIRNSYGPIAHCVQDLALVLEAWSQPEMRDHDETCAPLKFDHDTYNGTKPLRIGYFDYNHIFECSEVVKSVIKDSVEHLKAEGHTLVPFDTQFMKDVPRLFTQGFLAVSGNFMMEILKGEDPSWPYKLYYYQNKTWLANIFFKLSFRLGGYKQISSYLDCIDPISLQSFCEISAQFLKFKYELTRYWSELKLDAVVCPIFPLVAPLLGSTMKIPQAFSYSFVWNVADYPAGVLPTRLVREGEDRYDAGDQTDTSVQTAKEIMKNSVGLPVSVQVVAKPFEDEKALRIMKSLEGKFRFNTTPVVNIPSS